MRTIVVLALLLTASSLPAQNDPGAHTGPYKGFGYDWENNDLGLDPVAPKPWTPVERDGNTLRIWNRAVTWDKGLLPAQVESNGHALLAGPMTLRLTFNGDDLDAPAELKVNDPATPERATIAGSRSNRHATVNASMALEFDGFLLVDLAIEPRRKDVKLEKLIVEIPFDKKIARYFSRDLNYDYDLERVVRSDILNSAGRLKDGFELYFNHHLWIGGNDAGIELEFETNKDWSSSKEEPVFFVKRDDRAATLRVVMVDEPTVIDKARHYRFGFYITPVRPMDDRHRTIVAGWRTWLLRQDEKPDDEGRLPKKGEQLTTGLAGEEPPEGYDPRLWTFQTVRSGPTFPKTRKLPRRPMVKYFSLPEPPDDPKQLAEYKALLKTCHDAGARFIPYSSLMMMDLDIPEADKYLPYWERELGKRRHHAGLFRVSLYPKSIRDFLVYHYVKAATEWGQDGLYYDIASVGDKVVNPKAGGVDIRGTDWFYKPTFSVRQYHKRLYRATKSRHADFQITQHHGKVPVLFGGFSDIIYSGESMNAVFLDEGTKRWKRGEYPEGHPPYEPDFGLFPDDFYLASYCKGTGIAHRFMPNIIKWNPRWPPRDAEFDRRWFAKHRDELVASTRAMMARMLAMDVPLWRTRLDIRTYDRAMLAFQQYFGGFVPPVNHIGPWTPEAIRTNDPANERIYVGAYTRPKRKGFVLVVSNWGREAVTETVRLNFDGIGAGLDRVTGAMNMEKNAPVKHDDRSVTVDLPANDYRLIWVE